MTIMTDTTNTAANLVAAKTICLSLTRGRFGNKKRASMAGVEIDADKDLLRMAKKLLDSPELKAVQHLDSEVARYLRHVAFSSMFKGGVYLIPLTMVEAIDAKLREFAETRETLVDIAVAAYPTRVQETAERLGTVYVPGDYPTADEFRARFRFEWQYVTFDTPTRLKAISATIFEQEREKAAAKLSAVADECRDAMRAGLASMVDRLIERLTPDDEGKPKTFTKTVVTNLHDFLSTFELRNVTDDSELAAVVAQARAAISGIDASTLRKDDLVRAGVLDSFTKLSAALDPLIVDRGNREISFDDDDL